MKSLNMLEFLLESVASMKLMSVIAIILLMVPSVSAQIEMYNPEMPPDMEIEMFEESFSRDRDVLWAESSAVWTTSYFSPTYLEETGMDEFGRVRKYIHTNCTGFSVNITESRWFNITKDEFPYWSEGNNLTLSKVTLSKVKKINEVYCQYSRSNMTEGDSMRIGFNETLTQEAVIDGDGIGFAVDLFVYNESLIHRWDIQFLVNFTISVYFISMYVWRYIVFGGCVGYEPLDDFSIAIIVLAMVVVAVVFIWNREGMRNGTRKSEPAISDTGNNRIRADN